MDLKQIVAVSGMPGLYELVNTRNNGIMVKDFDNGKVRFVSMRRHQFTPLGTVAIYTYEDATELDKIFKKMKELEEQNPVPNIKENSAVIKKYFEIILPEFDKGRVHVSDIKKVIKWYNFLKERDLLTFDTKGDEEE